MEKSRSKEQRSWQLKVEPIVQIRKVVRPNRICNRCRCKRSFLALALSATFMLKAQRASTVIYIEVNRLPLV